MMNTASEKRGKQFNFQTIWSLKPISESGLECLVCAKFAQTSSSAAGWSTTENLMRTSVYDNYSGSMKITTHLDHMIHC